MADAIDAVWLSQLAQGSEKAFRMIFEKYYSLLCAISYNYIGEASAGESIAEDVFLMLWEKREELVEVNSLKSYLMVATRNKSIDYLRTHREDPCMDIESLHPSCFVSDEALFEQYIVTELEEKIDEAVASLPEECRQVFCLSRYEEKSYLEIAELLNISVNTVKYHIKNALSQLRDLLRDYLLTTLVFYTYFYFH